MKAYLVLEDGSQFEGVSFGATGESLGEVIFSTSMTGYQELLTDPSYAGQILISTLAHVGNVGINSGDYESSQAWLKGFVVQDTPRVHSNWRAESNLGSWLANQGIVSICDLDTRAAVRHLRSKGAMKGGICSGEVTEEFLAAVKGQPSLSEQDLVTQVGSSQVETVPGSGAHVVCFDFGMKNQMNALMKKHGVKLTRVPAHTSAEDVLALKPDGVFLSNGPGDPASLEGVVTEIQQLLGKVPLFGICLGHQLLARALGADTYKLKFGHHGSNHPVKDLATGRVEITTQNHGFAVASESLPKEVKVTHINLNDQTCEGLEAPQLQARSVQYHPENAPGPHDSRYLFEDFLKSLEQDYAKA